MNNQILGVKGVRYKSWFHKFWFGGRCVSWGGQRFTATRQKKIEFLKPATCVSGVKDFARGFQFYAIFRWSSYANSTGELKKISSLLWIWSTFRVWVLVSNSAQGSSALVKHVKIFYHAGLLLNCLLKLKKILNFSEKQNSCAIIVKDTSHEHFWTETC